VVDVVTLGGAGDGGEPSPVVYRDTWFVAVGSRFAAAAAAAQLFSPKEEIAA